MGRKNVLGDSVPVTIRIRKEQKEKIDNLVKDKKKNYKDLSDFVRKAIDDRLGLEWLK